MRVTNEESKFRLYIREVVLGVLILSNIFVWTRVYGGSRDTLRVYFLDVGQGDAVLVESPSLSRVLIDGGRNRRVVSELGKVLPFADRRIDVVIATHPDTDHIGGLPEVFAQYDVGAYISTENISLNDIKEVLVSRVGEEGSVTLVAKRGMVLDLGEGVKFEILFPYTDVSNWESNDSSIVARLTYGESTFLFTGDSPLRVENMLMSIDGEHMLDVDVLKVGHHGSRTSTSLSYAQATTPLYSVISAGKDNSYGHPHSQVLENLRIVGSEILNTALVGTVLIESDGREVWVR